jgi:hypothetical protein
MNSLGLKIIFSGMVEQIGPRFSVTATALGTKKPMMRIELTTP